MLCERKAAVIGCVVIWEALHHQHQTELNTPVWLRIGNTKSWGETRRGSKQKKKSSEERCTRIPLRSFRNGLCGYCYDTLTLQCAQVISRRARKQVMDVVRVGASESSWAQSSGRSWTACQPSARASSCVAITLTAEPQSRLLVVAQQHHSLHMLVVYELHHYTP